MAKSNVRMMHMCRSVASCGSLNTSSAHIGTSEINTLFFAIHWKMNWFTRSKRSSFMALPFFQLTHTQTLSLFAFPSKSVNRCFSDPMWGEIWTKGRVKNRGCQLNQTIPHLVLNYPNLNSNPLLLLKNHVGVTLLIEAFKRTQARRMNLEVLSWAGTAAIRKRRHAEFPTNFN